MAPAPTAPRNLKLTVESSTSIKASWTKPLKINGVFKRYVVMYGLSKDSLSKSFYSFTTEYSLAPLDEFTTYYVQVHAETSVTGLSSDIISARTNEDAPSSAPIIDRKETKAEDAHTIRVKWNEIAKEDQNGFILGYAVLYKEKGQQNSFRLNTTSTDTIIRRLKPYTEYCIQVQGFTKAGESPFSPCFDVRTLDKGPSQPLNVQVQAVSSVSILVKWDAPAHPNGEIKEYIIFYGTSYDVQTNERKVTGSSPELTPSAAPRNFQVNSSSSLALDISWGAIPIEKRNGKLLGYYIYYRVDGSAVEYNKTVGPDKLSDQLTGLEFTTYVIRIAGYTVAGVGLSTRSMSQQPKAGSPGSPKDFRAQVITANEVDLTWKEPVNSNGIVRFYYIKIYNTETGLQFGKLINESAFKQSNMQQHNKLISDLKYFTDYTFTIQAVTVKPGEMANATARTEEGVPSQPRDVAKKLEKGEISVTVTWKDPKDHNGIITMYTVYFEGKRAYDPSFTDNHEIVSGNTSRSTEIGIAMLKPGTEYSIYVKAKTVKGYGAESDRVWLKRPSKRPPPPKRPQVVEADVTTTTITISLSPSNDTNGEIIRHQIIVEMLETARARRETTTLPGNIYGFEEAETNGDRFYIAAMFERRKLPAEFVLGNGKTYGGYENVPLKPGTRYKVRHQIIVEMLETARARRETTSLPVNIYDFEEAETNGDRFYIAAMFERRKLPAEFVLGNGKTYGGYENVPLKPGTRYKVYVRGVTERDGAVSQYAVGCFFFQKWLYGEPAAISLPETECVVDVLFLTNHGKLEGNKIDESPVVKEGDNMVGVIAGVLGVLILIVIAIIAFHLYQRSNRPPNANLNVESQNEEFELRRSNARVTTVESDQTQENLTLVPVGVTTQLMVSESNEHHILETEESSLRRNRPVFTRNDGAFE
ncbi:Phosphatidylinositol phosphatase PTPRQ [Stylophora pistillata]|uniref:Phosphatidylinositol phosphatase PTPRQ n=1 Tax=Stylophora pistillata TaxID=50429 RepID=A0A2B4RK02_STYPI|nr:Phosphatidylinositol phosphatase PTPRQ [Stylophora pistillata]